MVKFINLEKETPYHLFLELYKKAKDSGQENVDAICISSFDNNNKEVDARFVNLKYIKGDRWFFYSNYDSPKSIQFKSHNQISSTLFWSKINVQVRIKSNIFRATTKESDEYFKARSFKKNILAISSNQSREIQSFDDVKEKYRKKKESLKDKEYDRPSYWGGFYFVPFSFEFWEGNEFRLNKRTKFKLDNETWVSSILEP